MLRMSTLAVLALVASLSQLPAAAAETGSADASAVALPDDLRERAIALRDKALGDPRAFDLLASLTTEVGPRPAGSAADKAAVAWAMQNLKALGFRNVRAEPVEVPHWDRGDIAAEILAPYPQEVVATALGGSIGTPNEGITAPVLAVESLDELKALAASRVRGKIVYIGSRMERHRDGSGYSPAVQKRSDGASEAAKLGAVAVVIRSVGTDNNRIAHTGMMRYEDGVRKIPAIALSNPDADLLERQLATGQDVMFSFTLSARQLPNEMSANVIGEIPGDTDEFILLGAHLDSWDAGTGAHDDGAGVAIVTMAAKLIDEIRGDTRRGIRVVLFANEEFGLTGAKVYRDQQRDAVKQHAIAMEADFGAGRVWSLSSRVDEADLPKIAAIHQLLEPLDIERGNNEAYGGADINPMVKLGVPVIGPRQDGTLYFDLHHTDNDTLDKVNPEDLRQNVAVYAVSAYVAAELDEGFQRLPNTEDESE
ncbi:MAG: M28 family peptidase [Gammaproteobacteria bacterium]|nr:M28 family peptidase [Gammaproteobacteria bacterium]